tara:strand:- start:416 stop:877 length:462 start_codon:yes stop_codon:yes gene_type:complete
MSFVNKGIVVVIILFSFSFCVSKNEFQVQFPVPIDSVYCITDKRSQEKDTVKSGIHIVFKEALPHSIKLVKVYFNNQVAKIDKVDKNKFVAFFFKFVPKQDLILNSNRKLEYGNKAPVITQPKSILSPNDAVLEYKMKNKTYFFKFINLKEKQ